MKHLHETIADLLLMIGIALILAMIISSGEGLSL
jgi:hypothetical protein